jgi:hypothetical protein
MGILLLLILVDSNSYLRIARELHPLLGRNYGTIPYLLNIHRNFEDEYSSNSRLQNKFHWVNERQFVDNRQANLIRYRGPHIGNIILFEKMPHIRAYKQINKLTISNVDIMILASALVLNIPVLTDDPDMLSTAEEFEIVTIKTIPFLAYLFENSEVTLVMVSSIFRNWEAIGDCPTNYNSDRRNFFPTIS